jgi:Holliday junction resolvase
MTIKSRRKGAKAELELVQRLQDAGFAAEKISRMYKRGPDLSVPLLGVDHSVEVKVRARGFQQLYGLAHRRRLVGRARRSQRAPRRHSI